jgi:ABC-type phosphate/phosphonate transport system ATPase subunit
MDVYLGTKENDGGTASLYGADRRKHCAVFGKSGVGKTTLMRNMIVADIFSGNGVTVVARWPYRGSHRSDSEESHQRCRLFQSFSAVCRNFQVTSSRVAMVGQVSPGFCKSSARLPTRRRFSALVSGTV